MISFLLFILFISVDITNSYTLSRANFIRNNIIHFALNKNPLNINHYNQKALIISCNKIGKQVLNDLKTLNIDTSVTTTKPKRFEELSKISNNVFIIPQMEINQDIIFRNLIHNNDIIIIADTISIFSIHTFIRTCLRIKNSIINNNNNKTIILISSVNVYGIHTNGEIVNELSSINNNNNNNNNNWQINHIAIANLIRNAENHLLDLMNNYSNIRTIVLRTSLIFDKNNINEIKKRNFNLNNFTKDIGNSYMSISFTDEISNCIKWIITNPNIKGCFNLVSKSYKQRDFYDKLFDIIGKKRIKWIDNNNNHLDLDYYYSMDINPLLPNSQRFNMIVNCDKIENNGYKFKFKDIWKKLKSYF